MHRTLSLIVDIAAQEFGVTRTQILGRQRTKCVARARLCVMWVARKETDMSSPDIGRELDRDHSTVLHAEGTYTVYVVTHQSTAETTRRVLARLRNEREAYLVRNIERTWEAAE
jgi:chromosomal replication initiator protein